jgi:LacI family transcriptional regulator
LFDRIMERKRSVLVMLGWNDPRLLAGIGRMAKVRGWHLAMRFLFERELPDQWEGDGILVSQSDAAGFNACVERLAGKYPAVVIGGIPGLDLPAVDTDHIADGRLAARYFLERGYRNYGAFDWLCGPVSKQRCSAFREAVEAEGHSCTMLHREPTQVGRRPAWVRIRERLASQLRELPKPLALFAHDDLHSVEVVEACLDAGLDVPKDVAVLGVGNLELPCECSQVPLSSIEYDMEGVGYTAAGMLEQLMDGGSLDQSRVVLEPRRLVTRHSTSALAVDDPRLVAAIRYMQEHISEDIGIVGIAEGTGIPARTLQGLFKEVFRNGPARFLLQLRLDRACEMLLETDLTVQAIAEACGLSSLRNVNRCFNRELGISPREFRKSRPSFAPMIPSIDWK